MHVAITYDLRDEYLAAGYSEDETAEFDRADTIDAIDAALVALGHRTERIGNARQLLVRLADGGRWDLVFNLCEGLRGIGREAQVPALLELHEIPCTFADSAVMSLCLHKGWTKSVVRDAGLSTPRSWLVERIEDLSNLDHPLAGPSRQSVEPRFPLFAKPVAEGTGKGVRPASRIADRAELNRECSRLLDDYRQPVLVEEFLPGREFTVGLLGTGLEAAVLGTLEIILSEQAEPGVYSYLNKERCEELVEYRLVHSAQDAVVRQAEAIAVAAWRALGGRDAGRIDLRCDADGNPQFREANPLAGLHPCHSDLPMLATAVGMDYVELIERIVASAAARAKRHAAVLAS